MMRPEVLRERGDSIPLTKKINNLEQDVLIQRSCSNDRLLEILTAYLGLGEGDTVLNPAISSKQIPGQSVATCLRPIELAYGAVTAHRAEMVLRWS